MSATLKPHLPKPGRVRAVPTTAATPRRRSRSLRSALVWVSAAWLVGLTILAVFADVLPLADPSIDVGLGSRLAPFFNWSEPLGTDQLGRSQLSRIIYGARISLSIGVLSAGVAMVLGGLVGIYAGYRRGRLDRTIGVVNDAVLAFPPLVLLLALAASVGPGFVTVVAGLVTVAFPRFVRVSRANALRLSDSEFVRAARVLGARPSRIVVHELLPNVAFPVAAYGLVLVAVMIIAESSLSFLGLGVRPPTPTWGVMIASGQPELRTNPHLVLVPALVLFVTVYAVNSVGDWAQQRANSGA